MDVPSDAHPGDAFEYEYRPGCFMDVHVPRRMFGGKQAHVTVKVPLDLDEAIEELKRGPISDDDVRLGRHGLKQVRTLASSAGGGEKG